MPLQTSPEQPAAVRTISRMIGEWIERMGTVWVEGQIASMSIPNASRTVFITLRDTDADLSLSVTVPRALVDRTETPISKGDRVIVHAKPDFYVPRGTLSLRADEVRAVGLGELLARIERLRQLLAAEGLFAPELKRRIPFLPTKVGLITGRDSAAQRDVVDNARARWPSVVFRIENTPVQGPGAVTEMIDAIARLDHDPEVDVIVIARGGGSPEELLVFSDEGLVRAAAKARTPIVSAIGHEQDSPLLDLVADVRASTPTDAARRVVPDMADEIRRVEQARARNRRAVETLLDRERAAIDALRARPALADPVSLVDIQSERVAALAARAGTTFRHLLDRAGDSTTHLRAQLRALSPQSTLERGYAVVQTRNGNVVRDPGQVAPRDDVRIKVAGGEFIATRS
jgi:exodeoxyribonuclease VII large subunit